MMYPAPCQKSLFLVFFCLLVLTARSQTPDAPAPPLHAFEILGLAVEGVEDAYTRSFVLQTSGLAVGQVLHLPGDPRLGEATRALYRLGLFADVKIVEDRRTAAGLYLTIQIQEAPRLADYRFEGVKKKHRQALKRRVSIVKGSRLQPGLLARTEREIRSYFEEKGHRLATVATRLDSVTATDRRAVFTIDPGPRIEVGAVRFEGNTVFSDRQLRRQMQTRPDRWWRFWRQARFAEDVFARDQAALLAHYHAHGYYDARILSDTTYLMPVKGRPALAVVLTLDEGAQYHIRDIAWEGNVLFSDAALGELLDVRTGDVYDRGKIERQLFAHPRGIDVTSQYLNRGYLRFSVQPTYHVVPGDSLDLRFDIRENGIYEFGDIAIAGNTRTKEHVIRRELYAMPGQPFNRDLIQESVRRLMQLDFFTQASLAAGPSLALDDTDQQVDLTYRVEEAGTEQLELSGTWTSTGPILQARFVTNNFSLAGIGNPRAWRPLPSGDGQQLSVGVQTSGKAYQSYTLGFTEPWFRGRPTPIGFNLGWTRYHYDTGSLLTAEVQGFYRQRLRWPDDKFAHATSLRYRFFDHDELVGTLPQGVSRELVLGQRLTRVSTDHPVFPTRGGDLALSLDLALPLPGYLSYQKWGLQADWYTPVLPRLTLGLGARYGWIGSLRPDEDVAFERYLVGGSPFDVQGANRLFGREVVFLRGYPAEAIGPRVGGEATGGRLLNRYTAELRWDAVQTPSFTLAPYLFLEAANTWQGFPSYDPANLFRAGGLGARMTVPMLGTVELVYGYNFDRFDPLPGDDGARRWRFQFSLGRSF